jgi:putative phage-type endonuclease
VGVGGYRGGAGGAGGGDVVKPRILATNVDAMTRDEWLEVRRKGIGGSDAAAVCGENPWRSPLAVWLSKVGQAKESETTEAMEMGNILEDPIAKHFANKTGYKIKRSNVVLQHPVYDFMVANVDRFVQEEDGGEWGVLEVKNVGEYRAGDWADGAIPVYYMLQVQHYMAVTGASYSWLCPLIGGNKLAPVKVERNDRLIANLIKIERDFWNLVVTKQPPKIDDSEDAKKILSFLYPQSEKITVVIEESLYLGLKAARQKVIDAEQEARGYENTIKDLLKDAEAAVVPGYDKPVATWKTSITKRLDVSAFEQAEPEIAQKYYKESPSRRFLVK